MMSGALGTASPTMNGKVGRAVPSAPQWCSCPDAPGINLSKKIDLAGVRHLRSCCLLMKHLLAAILCVFLSSALMADEPSRPVITNFNVSPSQRSFRFKPYPAASKYTLLTATNPAASFIPDTNFFQVPYVINVYSKAAGIYSTNFGYEWRNTNAAGRS